MYTCSNGCFLWSLINRFNSTLYLELQGQMIREPKKSPRCFWPQFSSKNDLNKSILSIITSWIYIYWIVMTNIYHAHKSTKSLFYRIQKQTTKICPKGRPLIQHLFCDTIWDIFGDINPSKQLPVLYIDIWYGNQLTSISTNLEIKSTGLKSPTSRNRVVYPSLQLDVILRMTTIQGIFLSEQSGM